MKTSIFHKIKAMWRRAAVAVLTTAMVACGGGGTTTGDSYTGNSIARPLPAEFLSRKAVAYSPYRTANRSSETPTKANIRQDLNLLLQGGFKLIRLFDSSDVSAKQILEIIREDGLDMKVMLGMYVAASYGEAANLAELGRGVALANQYQDIVLALSVGNETMVSWSFVPTSPTLMAGYIKAVRDRTTQPITTDDNWAFYADAPKAITDVIDFAAMHSYPLLDTLYPVNGVDVWNWKQTEVAPAQRASAMMDAAIASAKSEYQQVRSYLDSKGLQAMPIIIGETGWKAVASGGETQRAHPVNQKMYMDRLKAWTGGPKNIFYFEAFDEPWKQNDDKWGLFNVERKARYVVKDLYPSSIWEAGTANYTEANAAYFQPPSTGNAITASNYLIHNTGAVTGAAPSAALAWNPWDCTPCSAVGTIESGGFLKVVPAPKAWGWGFFNGLSTEGASENLSLFNAASGRLNFKVKTAYAGKIRVGFQTLNSAGTTVDVFMTLGAGEYGYANTDNWVAVSIPISTIISSSGNASTLDMSKVRNAFVINDVYSSTGNTAGATSPINIDAIYWSK